MLGFIKRKKFLNKNFLLFFLFLLIFIPITKPYVGCCGNDASRIATIESLVERGTFVIDESPFVTTIDKVKIRGHFYSSKPPILPSLGAGVYWLLHNGFGVSFPERPFTPNLAYYLLTLILIGGSSALLLVYFFKALRWLKIKFFYRKLLVFTLALGTLILVFSSTFNNHTPAAAFLFIGFYYLLQAKFEPQKIERSLFLSGLFTTLATVVEFTAGAFLILFFFYIASKSKLRKFAPRYIYGCLPFAIFHFILNYQITGDFIPQYFHKEFYNFPGSCLTDQKGINALREPKLIYAFNVLFGTHGLFLYTPVFLLSIWGWIKALQNKIFKKEALMIGIGIAVIIGYIIITSHNYGGYAYGMRWFIVFVPLLFFFTDFLFQKRTSQRLLYTFYVLAALSFIMAFIGLINPWSFPIAKHQLQYFPLIDNLLLLFYSFSL